MNKLRQKEDLVASLALRHKTLSAEHEAVAQQNAVLIREAEELRLRCAQAKSQFSSLRNGSNPDSDVRMATLNLIEDAIEERRRTAYEIAHRQRAERSLRRAEERLKSALDVGSMAACGTRKPTA